MGDIPQGGALGSRGQAVADGIWRTGSRQQALMDRLSRTGSRRWALCWDGIPAEWFVSRRSKD